MPKTKSFIFLLTLGFGVFVFLACQAKNLTTPTVEAEKAEPAPTPQISGSITIAAVGDILLGSPFPDVTRMPPNDGADLLKEVTPVLSAADITFGRLLRS